MEGNKFKFCPQCGGRNIETHGGGYKWVCPDCGFDLYNNVASAVGVIIVNPEGKVLFERRAKDPRKGTLAVPGGFTTKDESAEESVARECLEETGVVPKDIRYLCSCPNDYPYKGIDYKTCDLFFTARLDGDVALHAQEQEVSAFEWIPIASHADVDALDLGFPSARYSLHKWVDERKC
ncbi:MAG: NUDIX domain-containing protein [Treponema sp.]|nr:NUDIX domain-containing protein [Treponema sp.]MCR5623016.1 NUDIX domain-containing protein [Treponema sp.]